MAPRHDPGDHFEDIVLHLWGREFSLVDWKFLPRLKADDLVFLYLELDAALNPTEAAMRFLLICHTHCLSNHLQAYMPELAQIGRYNTVLTG